MGEGLVADSVARILADLADPQAIILAGDRAWQPPLWQALEENGLTLAWVPEELGGAGLGLAEGFEIVEAAGRFALPVPLAETMLAAWLLGQAGIAPPPGAMTVAPMRPNDRIALGADGLLNGTATAVAFADGVAHLVVSTGAQVALVAIADCTVVPARTLARDGQGRVELVDVRPLAAGAVDAGAPPPVAMGCAMRSLQIAGALQTILTRSVDYANERVAFGKTIGRFQAIQNSLARLAGEVAAATAAAGSAVDALAMPGIPEQELFLEIASAKVRCADAAAAGTAIAHQVHGAIGFSGEHALHRFTQRLWAWRDDFGPESAWALELGKRVAAKGAEALWPMLAAR